MMPIYIAEDIFVGQVPKLVVFDLDETVWPNHCDRDTKSPYTVTDGNILDRYGRLANCYPIIPLIIGTLIDKGIPVAYATRNPARREIIERLKSLVISGDRTLWSILPNEDYLQAYSSIGGTAKTKHFNALNQVTSVPFKEMLFFDDDSYNIIYAEFLGVTGMLVDTKVGFTLDLFMNGMKTYNNNHKKIQEISETDAPEKSVSPVPSKKQKTKEDP
jgi:magnesium-dependent phosphatase 1